MPGYAITASGAWNNKTAISWDPQINFILSFVNGNTCWATKARAQVDAFRRLHSAIYGALHIWTMSLWNSRSMGWSDVSKWRPWQASQENLRKFLKAKPMLIEERIHSNEHIAIHGVAYHGLSVCPFTRVDDYHVLRRPRINAAIELARWTRRGPCQLPMNYLQSDKGRAAHVRWTISMLTMQIMQMQFPSEAVFFFSSAIDGKQCQLPGSVLQKLFQCGLMRCFPNLLQQDRKVSMWNSILFNRVSRSTYLQHNESDGFAMAQAVNSFRRKCRWFPGQDSGTCRAILKSSLHLGHFACPLHIFYTMRSRYEVKNIIGSGSYGSVCNTLSLLEDFSARRAAIDGGKEQSYHWDLLSWEAIWIHLVRRGVWQGARSKCGHQEGWNLGEGCFVFCWEWSEIQY